MTALALRDDQTAWDEGQIAVLMQTGIDKDVTPPELTAFLHECQRRKLDPFTRQIYLIGRYSKRERRKVYRSQTSIDGFRLIARRAADAARESIEYEETTWYDHEGTGHEVWLNRDYPAACKVVVLRNGKRFPVVARFAAYVQTDNDGQPTQMWRKMPDIMIAKCAEALALRMAFPEELGGIYTEEEMAQADNPQTVRATAEVVHDEPNGALTALEAEVAEFGTEDAGRELWRKVAACAKTRDISRDDAKRLQDLITERITGLRGNAEPGIVDAEVVEAADPLSVYGLAPEDDWAMKVASIEGPEDADAATADVGQQVKSGAMTAEHGAAVAAAIDARMAELAEKAAA